MEHLRIFAAINVSVPSVRKLAELQRKLRSVQSPSLTMRWVPPANLHLTLKFYGNLAPEQVEAAADAAREAARGMAPFEIVARGLGVFPSPERPRVLWVGLTEGLEPLTALAGRLEDASETLGFERDSRPFQGHLTLGRIRQGTEGIDAWLAEHADVDCLASTIDEIVIYESRLHRTGAEYVSHYRVPFDGR
jgi:RNA 2',3'-cyclic 3'-phosphodiesterase